MKLTAGQVYEAAEAIQKLSAEKITIKGKYWISRIGAKLAREYQVIATQRNDLIRKHGEEKDGQISVPNGKMADFAADVGVLMAQEIEVDCPTVNLADLGSGDTEVNLIPLLPFIDAVKDNAGLKDNHDA